MSDPRVTGYRFWENVSGEMRPTANEIRYFGIVKRVPFDAFPRSRAELSRLPMEWDESPQSLLRGLSDTMPWSFRGWEPLPEGVLERFEAFDKDTGDLLIFWRIPCRRTG